MKRSEVSGRSVVLVGSFAGLTHAAIKRQLVAMGATVQAAVGESIDLAFVGRRGGAKEARARALGLTLFDEDQLKALLSAPAGAATSAKKAVKKAAKKTAKKAAKKTAKKTAKKAAKKTAASAFAGKKIVLTGAFVTMKRAEASKLLADAGASVGGGVSRKTDLLIYGDKAGSKLSKARTLGVALMTEAEFVQQLQGSGALSGAAADKIAQAQANDDQRNADVNAAIEAINGPQRAKYGATIPELLVLYLRVLAQRPDIQVYKHRPGRPTPSNVLRRLQGRIPDEALAFAAGVGPLEFNWVFKSAMAEQSNYSDGYNGGRVALVGFENFRWYAKPSWQEDEDFECDSMFDDFVAEGNTRLSYDVGQEPTDAALVFDNANDCARYPLGSIEEYITSGAKAAFTWYWQMGPGEFTDDLLRSSIARKTAPETIRALLVARGLQAAQAAALVKWLGDDVVVLLHRSATPEGRAAATLASAFPMADEGSTREMDIAMVEELACSTARLSRSELNSLLRKHLEFLDAGGGGGSWQTLSVSGLPMCIYSGPEVEQGAQAVFRFKNISGTDIRESRLSYADFSGCCGRELNASGAELTGMIAIDSVLERARFDGATLRGADFSGCRLAGASFRGADLRGADFERADLQDADFREAKLEGSRFPGATLTGAKR